MQSILKQPFTNVQLELLKTFSHNLPENDLLDLKKTLATFFANKLVSQADMVWNEQKWNDEKVVSLIETKMRKSKS